MDYRYGSHTVFKIEYHFVWTEEMIKQYLEHHFEPGTTSNFDVEP
jgi:hypothetical protein